MKTFTVGRESAEVLKCICRTVEVGRRSGGGRRGYQIKRLDTECEGCCQIEQRVNINGFITSSFIIIIIRHF